jgi:hypothetical protein
MSKAAAAGFLFALALASAPVACSGPPSDETYPITAPSRDSFPPVADVLHANCGSLDCHGDKHRNLRIYGYNGLRLNAISGTGATSPEEYEATYESVVLLEPELMAQVVTEHGREPERLSLVRKGRGTEHHKGGTRLPEGSMGDRCVTSWLAQAVDVDACTAAAEVLRPDAQ